MAIGKKTASDPRGAKIHLYYEIVDSNAWRCLSSSDQRAYIALQRQLRSWNNGDLSLPLTVAKEHGIASSATLVKSLRALVAVGLIAVTVKGRCDRDGHRQPTLYRFTDFPVFHLPKKFIEALKPTNEWRKVNTLKFGRELIRLAEIAAAEKEAAKKITQLQKLNVTSSKNEAVGPLTSSKIETWELSHASIFEAGKKSEKGCKPNAGEDFKESPQRCISKDPASKSEALMHYCHTYGQSGRH